MTISTVIDVVTGMVLLAAGCWAWLARRDSRIGLWLVLSAVAWFAAYPLPLAVLAARAPLAQAMLTFPSGRAQRWGMRAAVAAAYLSVLLATAVDAKTGALVLAVLVLGVSGHAAARARGPARRGAVHALGAAVLFAGSLLVLPVQEASGLVSVQTAADLSSVLLATSAVWLAVAAVRARWAQPSALGLVVDVGQRAGGLRERLRRTVGDPSLELGYRVVGTDTYVDDSGATITTGGAGRTVTPIVDHGRQIAIVVHDESIPLDDYLRSAILSVARLTATTATMQAESRERVSQLASSRARLVQAADDERRRVSARIDDGPGQRLREAENLLSVAQDTLLPGDADGLGAISQEVSTAADELARLARGSLPRLLVDAGLRAALMDVAGRFPCPVSVDVPSVRLRPLVESTTYFVCAEALANVAKHAGASRVGVEVTVDGDALRASIVDDGGGGAPSSPDGRVRGSGLDGLVDRVEALNGRLVVESHEGRGTALHLWIPAAITAPESTA